MWLEIMLSLLCLILLLYLYSTKNFGKWQSQGVRHSKGYFPFGSYNFLSGKHLTKMNADDHKIFATEKYFGYYLFGQPVLAINDVNLLRQIQVKDFDHFVDRISAGEVKRMFSGGGTDKIWENSLTNSSGDRWKEQRSTFTPVFTSGKMKWMMKFILHIAEDLTNEIDVKAKCKEEFELKDVFGKYSLDVVASSAFGINPESFTNKKSKFVAYAADINKGDMFFSLSQMLRLIPGFSQLMSDLNIATLKPKATKFFRDVILQTIRTRKVNKEKKNDMVDLMLDCLKDDTPEKENNEESEVNEAMKLPSSNTKLDEFSIVATAYDFIDASYDTTSVTLSYLSYEMAKNPDIQKRLQEEIDQAFEESKPEFPDYNTIQNLPFLDMVIHETLRLHPPAGINFRAVTKDYNLPGTNIILKTNDMVSWNASSVQSDPEHWAHPTEFYPEHFSKEEKANRSPYAFQAFGQGPRACIGMRFALLNAKVAVLSVLRRFSFTPGTKTEEPLHLDPDDALGWVKGGLWVRVEHREDS